MRAWELTVWEPIVWEDTIWEDTIWEDTILEAGILNPGARALESEQWSPDKKTKTETLRNNQKFQNLEGGVFIRGFSVSCNFFCKTVA